MLLHVRPLHKWLHVCSAAVLSLPLFHRRDPIAALQARASSAVSARSVPSVYMSPPFAI